MELETMTREERSLLLFLETQAVDFGGKVYTASLNLTDLDIALRWRDIGFIKFGRLLSALGGGTSERSHVVILLPESFALAAAERKRRAESTIDADVVASIARTNIAP